MPTMETSNTPSNFETQAGRMPASVPSERRLAAGEARRPNNSTAFIVVDVRRFAGKPQIRQRMPTSQRDLVRRSGQPRQGAVWRWAD